MMSATAAQNVVKEPELADALADLHNAANELLAFLTETKNVLNLQPPAPLNQKAEPQPVPHRNRIGDRVDSVRDARRVIIDCLDCVNEIMEAVREI